MLAEMSNTTLELEDNTTEDLGGREVEYGLGALMRKKYTPGFQGTGLGFWAAQHWKRHRCNAKGNALQSRRGEGARDVVSGRIRFHIANNPSNANLQRACV